MALFQSSEASSGEETEIEELVETTPLSAGDPVATLAAGSVLLAWFNFYVRGKRDHGIFIGLWAPTLLAAASYLQQKDIVRKVKRGFSSV